MEESNEIRKEIIGSKEICIKPYRSLPCAAEIFTINGIDVYYGDFGGGTDVDPENAPDYGCGCRIFERTTDLGEIEEIMKKYSLTMEEFDGICKLLEEELYVGECYWCV